MFVVRLGEVCSHIAAILVAVKQCVREGLNAPSVTSEHISIFHALHTLS